jgi:hypothetical protein
LTGARAWKSEAERIDGSNIMFCGSRELMLTGTVVGVTCYNMKKTVVMKMIR